MFDGFQPPPHPPPAFLVGENFWPPAGRPVVTRFAKKVYQSLTLAEISTNLGSLGAAGNFSHARIEKF